MIRGLRERGRGKGDRGKRGGKKEEGVRRA